MKILVLNGSPKRDKSDTMHMTRAFLEGMKEAGEQEVRIIHAVDLNVKYCTGCLICMHNGGRCIQEDDMKEVLQAIVDSDLIIFSFGLYCYAMPAPLKAVVDRTVPLSSMIMKKHGERYEHVRQGDFSKLRFLMIAGCGFPNSKHNFEPAVGAFRLKFPEDHTIITVSESPMFSVPEAAPLTEPRLALLRKAGRQYAEAGAIEESLMAEITSPMMPEDQYAAIVNSGV